MNWDEEIRRAEERYAASQTALQRFEYKMAIIMVICSSLLLVGIFGLLTLKVMQ
jgi:hypothetical protein